MVMKLRFSEQEVSELKDIFESARSQDLPVSFYIGEENIDVAYGGIFRGFDMGTLTDIGDDVQAELLPRPANYTEALMSKPSGNPYANVSDDGPIVVELKKLTEAVNRLNPRRMAADHNHFSR